MSYSEVVEAAMDKIRSKENKVNFSNQAIIEYGYVVKDLLEIAKGHKLFFEQANCYDACFYKVRELLRYVNDEYLTTHLEVKYYFLNDFEINNDWDRIRFEKPEQWDGCSF